MCYFFMLISNFYVLLQSFVFVYKPFPLDNYRDIGRSVEDRDTRMQTSHATENGHILFHSSQSVECNTEIRKYCVIRLIF